MSELAKVILGGVAVFVLGQIVVHFLIEPVKQQRLALGDLLDRLIFYADIYSNPGTAPPEVTVETARKLRESSSQLQARTYVIPLYDWLARMGFVRTRKQIDEASSNLIGLSNSLSKGRYEDTNMARREVIMVALGFKKGPEDPANAAAADSDKLSDR